MLLSVQYIIYGLVFFMGVPTGRKWIAFSLLVVILLVSLLATLILTGTLSEPQILEIITVEPARWQRERPELDADHSLSINETIESGYSNNDTTIGIDVHLFHYLEDWNEIPFGEHKDGITFRVDVAAAVAEGFDSFFVVRFRPVDAYSTIYIERQFGNVSGQYLATDNATIIELRVVNKEWMDGRWHNVGEAYVKAKSTSSQCGLRGQIHWVFNDQNTEDHLLEASLEFTYFNQRTSQKTVVPIILDMPVST